MIDKETLMAIAKLNNLRPWQQEKHYIQSLILVALSEYPLVLKGGTYLWFFHGMNRFSEDLDFTSAGKLPENLDEKISEALSMFGVETTGKIMAKDWRSFSFRISANGPLYTSQRDACHVYVEISKREKILRDAMRLELNFDAYRIPLKIISGMALDEVAAEKVRAITMRDKARDAFDLAFLIEKKNVKPDLAMINEKLKYYGVGFSKETFMKRLEEKGKAWEPELRQLTLGRLQRFESARETIERWISQVG